jgi:hypothetical protein
MKSGIPRSCFLDSAALHPGYTPVEKCGLQLLVRPERSVAKSKDALRLRRWRGYAQSERIKMGIPEFINSITSCPGGELKRISISRDPWLPNAPIRTHLVI